MKAVLFHQPVQGNDMALIASGIARKMASAGLLMALVATLSACGGGGEDNAKTYKPLSTGANGSSSAGAALEDTGSPLMKKLRHSCPELHNSDQISAMACAAGTYQGTSVTDSLSCTTVLTETGGVTVMYGTKVAHFRIAEDFLYHKDVAADKKTWLMEIRGKNEKPLFLTSRRASFKMTIDSRTQEGYLDVVMENTDPKLGDQFSVTCRTRM